MTVGGWERGLGRRGFCDRERWAGGMLIDTTLLARDRGLIELTGDIPREELSSKLFIEY